MKLDRSRKLFSLLALIAIFGLTTPVAQAQLQNDWLSTVYSFNYPGGDGTFPRAGLIMDAAGNFYGTTANGGSGSGTVFELVNNNGSYTEQLLYTFTGSDGANPQASLTMDSAGNLYGTTSNGGAQGLGIVFELVNSNGSYSERVLHSFSFSGDGYYPQGSVVVDSSGNVYGTTSNGGASGYGTIFELVNSSGSYTEQLLFNFSGAEGANPYAGLIMDSAGNLYGTTYNAGAGGRGTVFELVYSPPTIWLEPGGYAMQVLHAFAPGEGANPRAGLLMDSAGNLYGTTFNGGPYNKGTVFELTNSSGSYNYKILNNFTGDDGYNPMAGLIMDAAGNLYGTTSYDSKYNAGTVFELVNSSGTYTEQVLYFGQFCNTLGNPLGGVVMDSNGKIYGTVYNGGDHGVGAVFSLAPFSGPVNSTSTVVTSSANPANAGDSLALTATLTSSLGYPQGSVSFSSGSLQLGTASVSCGTASATVEDALILGIGTSTITARYTPSVPYYATSSGTMSQSITESGVVTTSSEGQPNGVAMLDANGQLPASELPNSGGTPAILTGWCSGAASSTSGANFSFAGLGSAVGTAGTACSNNTSAATVMGIPVTSAGTLTNLYVAPGTLGNVGTHLTFTVYKAAAPGWAWTPNQTTISNVSVAVSTRTVTLTVKSDTNLAVGDQITVSGITQNFNAGTNCSSLSGTLLNGTYTVASKTSSAIAYVDTSLPANCGTNVSGATASGSVADNTHPSLSTVSKITPSATALSCTIGPLSSPSAATCSDTIDAVSVNPGDLISIVAHSARSSGTETIGDIRVSLEKK